jgi:ABC-type sugar transport system ATPase subunit
MPRVHLQHITKVFPGVKALSDVSLGIEAGEIHALCGENGAGKSTLMNILAGNLQPDAGVILIEDEAVIFDSPEAALKKKIAVVYQHLSLISSLSVAENIFANQQPVNTWGLIEFDVLYKNTSALLDQLDLRDIPPGRLVENISPAERQMVEIAKALSKHPSVFILDEPTASLTTKETRKLFEILRTLRTKGVSIIYISHRLEEIFELADRVTILKDGKFQGTFKAAELTRKQLISKMVGRELGSMKTSTSKSEEILLSVENLNGQKFSDVSFRLFKGEILGLSGLVGAGRTEIARALFGAGPIYSGRILFQDQQIDPKHPAEAIGSGIAYITEDRKSEGLFPDMTVAENVMVAGMQTIMTSGIYNKSQARDHAEKAKDTLRIAVANTEQKVGNLSGGNQQKVMLAKWLITDPEVLIIDEPTHGIDVGAKYQIYEIVSSLAKKGKGIIMISSEMAELIGLCDRIIVIKNGRITGELSGSAMTEENILQLAT